MKTSAFERIEKGDLIHFRPNDRFACFFDLTTQARIK